MRIELRPHSKPGFLIALCGADGSGKSTLEDGLAAALAGRGYTVTRVYQPSDWWRKDPNIRRTMYGEGDGAMLPDSATALFSLADRYAQQSNVILPALSEGNIVISNRYIYTVFAFILARRSLDLGWLKTIAKDIVQPDACILLDNPPDVLIDRVVARDGSNPARFDQQPDFLEVFCRSFRTVAAANDFKIVSGAQHRARVLDECLVHVCDLLEPGGPGRKRLRLEAQASGRDRAVARGGTAA